MKRYIFSVTEDGDTTLIDADEQKARIARYGSLDPSLTYLRRIHWILDADDLADIELIERHNYKDPTSALAKKFIASAKATAAGLAEVFARKWFVFLYVCIEVTDETYTLTVLQDAHPIGIVGGRQLTAPTISDAMGRTAIKNAIARIAGQLKVQIAQTAAQAVAALPASSGGMDM